MADKVDKIKSLTSLLNRYRDEYYNKNNPIVSDKEYDDLFDQLKELENETGFIMANSPTQSVGYEVKSELQKVAHNHPMLSLDKTKDVDDLVTFLGNKDGLMMLKCDGLTVSVRYLNGDLMEAETRGNGEIGEDILHNAKVFKNLPLHIDYKDELIVDGEAIITYKDFETINNKLPQDQKFKNVRNLASGSVRQLDSKITKQRNVKFIAWKVIKGFAGDSFSDKLDMLNNLGFDVVPYEKLNDANSSELVAIIEDLKNTASEQGIPIDGMVVGFDSISYGESLGRTSHHMRSQYAYKFYDECERTKLLDIDWSCGKTGQLTPTAVFEPVELDGTTVSRASLHNISVMEELYDGLWVSGLTIDVFKANMIIPQISKVTDEIGFNAYNKILEPPEKCPICGGKTEIVQENDSKVLVCTNPNCAGKTLGKLEHMASKNALDIQGLSEATLEKFIDLGFIEGQNLVAFMDIFELKNNFGGDIAGLDGFGEKSANKLFEAIEKSRTTTLDRFINALSIPLVGRSASKAISKHFGGDYEKFRTALPAFNFTQLDDFGKTTNESIHKWCDENIDELDEFAEYFTFEKESVSSGNQLKDMTFCITGSLSIFANREEAKAKIEQCGGKVSGSVSSKTSFLVNNDVNSTSGKNKKAHEIGIEIITEQQLIDMIHDVGHIVR